MRILITGATGLLGSHIVVQGLSKGHRFRAVSRRMPRRSLLNELKNELEIVETDLSDNRMVNEGLFEGIDCFINCLGFSSPFPKDAETMELVNVAIPKRLFDYAARTGTKRLIHISSIATMSDGLEKVMVNEGDQGKCRNTNYSRSKYLFDRWCDEQGFRLLRIHPCFMLGKWDSRPSSGSILFAMQKKKIIHWIRNIKNFVSPADVARGIFLAIEKDVIGDFILGNENRSIEDFVRLASSRLDLKHENIFFDKNDIRIIPDEELGLMEEFCLSNPVDISRAQSVIGYRPEISLEEMLEEAVTYFAGHNMIKIPDTIKTSDTAGSRTDIRTPLKF